MSRRVFIGLDGVPYRLLKDLSERGVMPRMGELLRRGIFRPMASSIPEVSSVAWSSLITGKNPAEHGIFGFTDLDPQTYELTFPSYRDLKCPPFWEQSEGRSVIINVPATYPVRPMNGVHVSGFVSLELEQSVYPSSLVPEFRRIDYRLDVESSLAHQSIERFLVDLDDTLQARIAAYRHLWKTEEWQTFMLVFTGTDRLMHFLWDAYEDEGHRHHGAFLDHFRQIDAVIGEAADQLQEDDTLVMASDHGFEALEQNVYVNYLLQQEGFLNQRNFSEIDGTTRAFAMDPARIYIHRQGRFSRGRVGEADREKILDDLESLFKAVIINGQSPFRHIFRREEVFRGPLLDLAPDLVLVADRGFNLKGLMAVDRLYGQDIFTGKHTQHDAFLFVKDHRITSLKDPLAVTDVPAVLSGSVSQEQPLTEAVR